MKRLLFLAAVLLPNCTGCVAFGFPTLQYVPELTVPNEGGGAHAFRVDVDTTTTAPDVVKTQYTLSRIPIGPRGIIPSQLELAPATGVYNPFGVPGVTEERNNYTMLVRVYRPGFKTIEVPAWDKSRELQWLPAADLTAQESQIDILLADPTVPIIQDPAPVSKPGPTLPMSTWWERKDMKSPGLGLQPGSVSSLHHQALQFASSEYSRLANGRLASGPAMQAVRERLQKKAIWLRRWADEAPKQP